MDQIIYVVLYAQPDEPVRLIKAFQSARRAAEYVDMLRRAPFPDQSPAGYQYQALHLN
ncbi:hypothetical protein [Lacticaseibacillus absianus]|uniref:hypothetical protein n=1 Tax=Lacticaseibacillus absianus TaxID=2729623 RepID=UPI0015C7DB16|nr:hypothetical protein [Lacticaseibacillus absianus]